MDYSNVSTAYVFYLVWKRGVHAVKRQELEERLTYASVRT